ncbi:MAG: glucose-1-phosphate cytidylyltransferase [Rickettsiales bacterium]|nr:glucose-1-phosphate cytidylyltransferase [Rickettsiales bacterium]
MKAVILAGGLGTRISEETQLKPKPMIEIGGKPILWHIMKIYSHYGINDFVICLGYKGYFIKEYFANYYRHMSDVTYDLSDNSVKIHNSSSEPWKVTLIDTGEDSMTGGRVKLIKDYIDGENFCMTYGDGVANVDIKAEIEFHLKHKKIATMLATKPPGRFGAVQMQNDGVVTEFLEKPAGDGGYINGGFFVLNRKIFDYIDNSKTIFEREPLENLAKDKQLVSYKHDGFWHAMDTLRDKLHLEDLWLKNKAEWRIWDNKK